MFYIICFPLEAQQMGNNSSSFQTSFINFAANSNRKNKNKIMDLGLKIDLAGKRFFWYCEFG